MNFSELLGGIGVTHSGGDPQISGLDYNSLRVKPGWVFVAMSGGSRDGNRYIDAAMKNGAVGIVTDSATEAPRAGAAWAVVPHGRKALAQMSANFYGRPAEKLRITGVTGTNGKTTTSFLIESILNYCGQGSALIGTIEYHVAGRVLPAPHTTPESLELNQMFAEALAAGATDVVMEVSSHALEQGRVSGIRYDVAVFTNLTRDHLDYHKDMESYFGAKAMLFQGDGNLPDGGTAAPRTAVVNIDDQYGRALLESRLPSEEVMSYGLSTGMFHARDVDLQPNSTQFDVVAGAVSIRIASALIGTINIYNLLAAIAATWAHGCSLEDIAEAIGRFKQVPGRFERVDCGQPFTVVVDYAHTDDALRNLTSIARGFVSREGAKGRVITVFGCGGDRDRTKRPLMGKAAGQGSDFVVLTADNPRSEDPMAIIQDSLPGLQQSGVRYVVEPDRKKAIGIALAEAKIGDMVLIAGKGHEKTQTTRAGTFPFDDVRVAAEILRQLGHGQRAGEER
jgi:UDP-N-acetylmuramoyl-L-alanyl-D-glutamate--2,6-diaminopimelate ligase